MDFAKAAISFANSSSQQHQGIPNLVHLVYTTQLQNNTPKVSFAMCLLLYWKNKRTLYGVLLLSLNYLPTDAITSCYEVILAFFNALAQTVANKRRTLIQPPILQYSYTMSVTVLSPSFNEYFVLIGSFLYRIFQYDQQPFFQNSFRFWFTASFTSSFSFYFSLFQQYFVFVSITSAGTSSRFKHVGFTAAICIAISRAKLWKSSVLATKSVSQLTSTNTPIRPPAWM